MSRLFMTLLLLLGILSCASPDTSPDSRIQVFYYPWYGTPERDGNYRHWAHDQMGAVENRVSYQGDTDIGADFYPAGGCYSSNDPDVLARHMQQIVQAGVGSLAVSWWGEQSFEDDTLEGVFAAAENAGLKVSLHLEPLPDRDAKVCHEALAYFLGRFSDHPALYRDPHSGLPLVFVYDSYLSTVQQWQRLLTPDGDLSIRGTTLDCVMIGLWVEEHHGQDLLEAGFDGMYSYFATDGFTYGSSTRNWPQMARFAKGHGMSFVPCVGPGYADLRIRPWNGANQRDREGGAYYRRMAAAAVGISPETIGLTSFNEWHEGTQIEPAQPAQAVGFTYRDYGVVKPDGYLKMTKEWIRGFPPSRY